MSDNLPSVLELLDRLQPAIKDDDRTRQVEIVGELISRRAPMGRQWRQIALLAAGIGELGLARGALDLWVEAAGGGAVARYEQAAVLALLGDWREADAVLARLPRDVPDRAANAYSRGTVALNLGRRDEAKECLEQATAMLPHLGHPWLVLSMAVDFAREQALAERLIAAEAGMEKAAAAERAPYFYALGKTWSDLEEHALAFRAFAIGAREMKTIAVYDRAGDRLGATQAIHGYTSSTIAALARSQREPTGRSIFVTGLPRSGTTLTEQILTSHSEVGGGAELGLLQLLARETGGPSLAALTSYTHARGAAAAAGLWHHWLNEVFPGAGRVVDKTVDASRFLGLAAALLPDAPLIWVTRDPLDRAWSCFRTNFFGGAMAWSYDLEDIAAHFRLEDELLARWREILGERLLVVPYERLVANPDAWIRRMLSHCGLSEEPQVFTPHENPRPVATASMVQVRRPIHRGGDGAAEPYREFLEPFVRAYTG